MNIEHHISQLLYRYQCVTVPGFGAFLTKVQSAQLINNSNSFIPPRKALSYNSHLKNNDGLLANHIAQSSKTSYENALRMIQLEVENWDNTLEKNEVLTLKNIGNLERNADKYLIFTSYDQINYLSSSFGLSSFISPSVKRQVYENPKLTVDESPAIPYVLEIYPNEVKKTSVYLKYAAVFIFGLGLTGTIGYPVYKQKIENETAIVKQSVQKQVQNKIQEATFFIESPVSTTVASLDSKMPYHIMAGAYREEQNAQNELDKLIKQGFNARRIPQNKYGLYPVVYGSYTSLAEAESVKQKIRTAVNQEAWLLIESL